MKRLKNPAANEMADLLEAASDTLRRLEWNGGKDGPAGYRSCMPAAIREYWRDYGKERVTVRPAPPSKPAIDELDDVLALVAGAKIEDWQRHLLWARAKRYPVPWKRICSKLGCKSRTTAWQEWVYALEALSVARNAMIKHAFRLNKCA